MLNWNVVVNVHEHSFSRAYLLLKELGTVYLSDFENVLLMNVSSIPEFLAAFDTRIEQDPSLLKIASSIVPVTSTFSFQSPEEFETKAKEAVLHWLPTLTRKKFYVRMHRRGFKGVISSHQEEDFLDRLILSKLEAMGESATITAEDPDVIVAVETVSQQAGVSCWNRHDLQRYPWLNIN